MRYWPRSIRAEQLCVYPFPESYLVLGLIRGISHLTLACVGEGSLRDWSYSASDVPGLSDKRDTFEGEIGRPYGDDPQMPVDGYGVPFV